IFAAVRSVKWRSGGENSVRFSSRLESHASRHLRASSEPRPTLRERASSTRDLPIGRGRVTSSQNRGEGRSGLPSLRGLLLSRKHMESGSEIRNHSPTRQTRDGAREAVRRGVDGSSQHQVISISPGGRWQTRRLSPSPWLQPCCETIVVTNSLL